MKARYAALFAAAVAGSAQAEFWYEEFAMRTLAKADSGAVVGPLSDVDYRSFVLQDRSESTASSATGALSAAWGDALVETDHDDDEGLIHVEIGGGGYGIPHTTDPDIQPKSYSLYNVSRYTYVFRPDGDGELTVRIPDPLIGGDDGSTPTITVQVGGETIRTDLSGGFVDDVSEITIPVEQYRPMSIYVVAIGKIGKWWDSTTFDGVFDIEYWVDY